MPLDAIFLHHLTNELNICIGARADKIHQPSRDELVILLRSAAFTGKLLISLRSGSARIGITNSSFDNPADPPGFCKLLRRHLSSAKITELYQSDLNRTVIIKFMTYNEMGDVIYPYLAVELITGRENLVLCDENGKILDALRRSDIESSQRLLLPGAKYTLPPTQAKLDPFTSSAEELTRGVLASNRPICLAFCDAILGVSPLISRELALRVCYDTDISAEKVDKDALLSALKWFKESLLTPTPYILKDTDGTAKDFSYIEITQYGQETANLKADGFSSLLEEFYFERDREKRIKALSVDISRVLTNAKNRAQRRMAGRKCELEKCKDRETFRIYGELIKANLYAIEKGSNAARVQNYYDENCSFIDIPLDPALSPAANAAKYFKEYKKSHTAEQTLCELLLRDEKEIIYIESVLDSLSRAQTAAELQEIREELYDSGYLVNHQKRRAKPAVSKPREFLTRTGFRVFVGRNNRENDFLTTKFAEKKDLWFHTKNIPGSHVILVTEGKEVDEESLLFAARVAATFSKAAESDNVPVDFTEVKNVKKPSGAKPGMVIYTTNKTIYAKPNISLVK